MDEDDLEPEFTPAERIESRSRDSQGRFLPEDRIEPTADEMLTAPEVILGLRRLWFQGRLGSKAALARATGFKDRRQLSAVLKGLAPLHEPIRRRCSRFLMMVNRQEMQLVSTGYAHSGYATFEWRRKGIDGTAKFRWDARFLKARDRRALDDRT